MAGSDNNSDNASIHNESLNNHQQPNIQPQIITTVSKNNAKFPYIKKDEYEVWAMKIEYWITNNDMNIWKSKSKTRTTLLQSILDDHIADFHYMDDVRDIWNAVKARFGGNAESKKMRKSVLKQEFLEFRISKTTGFHKGYDRMQKILSQLNQLNAKPDTEEINLRGYSTFSPSQSTGPSHSISVSATCTSKKMPYGDSPNHSLIATYSIPSKSKTGSHKTGNIKKLDLEEMDLKWQMAMLSVRIHKCEQKAGRKIDFDKKESASFNKQKVRCYKCQQRGHFARECRAKGGNDKQRYSLFKVKEIGKKEEDLKALITVDTLVDWSNHNSKSDEVITAKEFGMIVGCDFADAIKASANKLYNLVNGANSEEANTPGDAGEFALMGVTSEVHNCPFGCDNKYNELTKLFTKTDGMKDVPLPLTGDYTSVSDHIDLDESQISYGTKSSTSNDFEPVTNDFVSCDDSDKSLDVKTSDFASSDSNGKSSEHKPTDSTSCASTSSVSTSVNEAEIESKVGTPDCDFYEKQMTNTTVGIGVGPAVRPQLVPTGMPKVKPVPTGKPKVKLVPTGRPKGILVPTGKPKVHPVPTGKPKFTPVPTDRLHRPFPVATDRGCSPLDNTFLAAEDEGIFDSGCSRRTIRTPTLDFENIYYVKELQQFNLFSISQICDKKNQALFTDTECLVLSKNFKLPDDSMLVLKVPRKHNLYTINLNDLYPRGNLAYLVAHASFDECVKWHRRMALINYKNMNSLVKGNLVRGLPSKLFKNGHTYVACCKGKQHKVSYKTIKAVSSISELLQLLHMDHFGPTSIRSIDHKYYYLVITDNYSRFCWVFFLEHKDETYPIFKNFINFVENQLNKKVKAIKCDNGTEFKNAHMIELCESKEIKREYSNPRTPQQNGVAERKNKTLIEAARTMLADSKLPTMFWTKAVRTACYVLNRVFVTNPHNKTPYALMMGNIPTVSHFKPFGCHVTILNTSDHLGKFDGNADEGYIFGYSASNKAYRVYNVPNKRVEETMNLRFLEDKPNVQGLGHEWYFDLDYLIDSLGYKHVLANQSAGTQGNTTNSADTPGDKVDDSSFPSADEIFRKELAKLKDQEQRVTSDAEELRTPAGVKAVLPGCIPVPTSRLPVLAGSVPVPTGSITVMKLQSLSPRVNLIVLSIACSRHQVTPTTSNLEAVNKIFKYLKGQPKLEANKDRKSTTGGCQFLVRRLISWQCKKLTIVATSSTEAEYVATANCYGQHKHLTILLQSSMVALKYEEEHNKVGYLLKPTGSDDYHQIIDFLSESHIRESKLGPPAILATINKTPYTITEALVRSHLQLANDGGEGAEVTAQDVPHPVPVPDQSLAHLPTPSRPQSPDPVAPVLEHDHSFAKPKIAVGPFPTTEDAPLRGDFHTSPPPSSHAPPAGQPSGGEEDPITLTAFSSVVSTLVQKVHSLEAELHDHKKLFKDVIGKLVKKVKSLEVKLKTKKRKVVVSDSDLEDSTTKDMDLDALRALANAAVAANSDIPSGNTSQVPVVNPCARTAGPSGTFEVPPTLFAIPPGVFSISHDPFVTPTAGPFAIPADSPNVPACVYCKGKSSLVEEDVPVTARERAEAQRKRQQEVLESTKFYNKDDWLNIRDQVEANASLSQTLLGDDVNEDNFPSRMAVLIKKKRQALAVVVDEDSDVEDSVDEVWSAMVGWELLSTPLGEINALYRIDGSIKHFATLQQILHMGDLQVLFDSQLGGKGSCVWNNASQWEIRSWRLYTLSNVHVLETFSGEVLSMFTDVSYPLSVELIKKMLLHK
nr:putative ribonuclease H-like domain-containing protein [Tanacetum cinerariifolium]